MGAHRAQHRGRVEVSRKRSVVGLRLALFASLVLSACSNGCGGASSETEPTLRTEGSSEVTPSESPNEATSPPPEAPPDPSPAPELHVELDGEDVLRVRNVGNALVRVRSAVKLERREGSTWREQSASFSLRASCDERAADCVALAPGAELLPPKWLGTIGDAQCACERCVPARGEVRFVIETCAPDGHVPHRVASAAVHR